MILPELWLKLSDKRKNELKIFYLHLKFTMLQSGVGEGLIQVGSRLRKNVTKVGFRLRKNETKVGFRIRLIT